MKQKRYTDEQIIGAIKQHESGVKVEELCRKLGISSGTFYNWWSKFAGKLVDYSALLGTLTLPSRDFH